MQKINQQQGLIRTVVFIVVTLLVLSYMGISVRGIVESKAGQDNFSYTKELIVAVWEKYLKEPAVYLYNEIYLSLIWHPFIGALKDLKAGKPTSIDPPELNNLPIVE